ncbi:hypothetical protein FHS20_000220 [Phyllobacterium endophyticum]|nr:hypothetical protein [Phyllobacterium endophyticum]
MFPIKTAIALPARATRNYSKSSSVHAFTGALSAASYRFTFYSDQGERARTETTSKAASFFSDALD